MLYPSIEQLTKGKVNRYALVIATSKCARQITEEAEEDHKPLEDKPLKVAINLMNAGVYQIVEESAGEYTDKKNAVPAGDGAAAAQEAPPQE